MNRVVFSSLSDHWATPDSLYTRLDREFSFDFDPCPLQSRQSGLLIRWHGSVFCNPPYSQIEDFMRKGLLHLAQGDCSGLVYLLPVRSDTGWFHDYCLNAKEIRFIRGRLRFGNAKNSAPFPSMVVVFDNWKLEELPMVAA